MDREKLDSWCERGILGLVLSLLVFGPLATGAVRPVDFLVIQALTCGVLAIWIARLWIAPRLRLLCPPISWAILAFVGYAVVRYRMADVEYLARQELIHIVVYATIFFAIVNNLHRQESMRIIALTLIFLGTAISFYVLYQWVSHSEQVWHFVRPPGYEGRGSGTYINPNHAAGLFEALIPVALLLAINGRLGAVLRILATYAGLAMVVGIALTFSRGGWLAILLVLFVLLSLVIRQRELRWIGVVATVLLLGAGIWFGRSLANERAKSVLTKSSGPDRDVRLRIWRPAWHMWLDHPAYGVGPGHFDLRYRGYRLPDDRTQNRAGFVHNDYLHALADYGAVGAGLILAVFGFLYWGVAWGAPYLRRNSGDFGRKQSNKSALVTGSALGLLALLIHAFLDFNFHVPANALIAVALMAMISAHLRFATEGYWLKTGLIGRGLGTVICGAAVAYLASQTFVGAQEHYWLRRAAGDKLPITQQLEYLKKAVLADPANPETPYRIGESLRLWSWEGEDNYRTLAEEAMVWLEKSMRLNRWDPYPQIRYGMCLHWLGRHDEAAPYFDRAIHLDPNNYYIRAHMGWHFYELGQYKKARDWFRESYNLKWADNPITLSYLDHLQKEQLVEKEEAAAASKP